MADYNDYLKYLKHVDDTTAQDFKARENVFLKDNSDLKAQFKEEKSKMEKVHKDEKNKMENLFNNNISDLKTQFKTKEDALKKEISDLQLRNKEEKSKIEKTSKNEIAQLKSTQEEEIAKLKEAQHSKLSKYKKDLEDKNKEILQKNDIINDLQSKFDNANHEIECLRKCNEHIQEQRNQLMYIRVALLCIGLILSFYPCFGIPVVIYLGYVFYRIGNKEKYVSVLRWARCDRNLSIYASRVGELFIS